MSEKRREKVLVCGSRSWRDADGWIIRRRLNELSADTTILHGDAAGADRIAHFHAIVRGMPVERFRPDYKSHGSRAPHVRNNAMLAKADLVLAFWDGSSRGTKSVIDKARRRGIDVEVIQP